MVDVPAIAPATGTVPKLVVGMVMQAPPQVDVAPIIEQVNESQVGGAPAAYFKVDFQPLNANVTDPAAADLPTASIANVMSQSVDDVHVPAGSIEGITRGALVFAALFAVIDAMNHAVKNTATDYDNQTQQDNIDCCDGILQAGRKANRNAQRIFKGKTLATNDDVPRYRRFRRTRKG